MTNNEIKTEENASESSDIAYSEDQQDSRNKAVDILTLRRTAGEVKRHKVIVRVISILLVVLIALVAIAYSLRKAGFDIASIYQLQRAVSPCTPLQWANSNDLLFDTRAHLTDNIAIIPVSSLNLSYHSS